MAPILATPRRMTPGKVHTVLAPETPSSKANRKKSDGTHYVKDSPDVDAIKAKSGGATPRRIRASNLLRKKTSFYSGSVSRNLLKAEEQLVAEKFESQSILAETKSRSFVAEDPAFQESEKRSSLQVLFPHLVNKKEKGELIYETLLLKILIVCHFQILPRTISTLCLPLAITHQLKPFQSMSGSSC